MVLKIYNHYLNIKLIKSREMFYSFALLIR